MTIKGNEMTVVRGETFTIDRYIVNRDGSPYIVSSEYTNPYLLLTVSSARYSQDERYIANWWLSLEELPRFKSTVPIKISSFDFVNVQEDEPGDYLYYVDDVKTCKYFDENYVWHEYNFRLIHNFLHSVTSQWIEQSYLYSIRLVAGSKMDEYIENLYKSVFNVEADTTKSTEELYNEIKNNYPEYVKGIDISRALATIDVTQDILIPTKLTVLSDLNGGLT